MVNFKTFAGEPFSGFVKETSEASGHRQFTN